VTFAPAHRSWLADSVTEALEVVRAAKPPDSDNAGLGVFARQQVALYLTLGRLADAELATTVAPPSPIRDELLLSVLAYKNDRERMIQLLSTRFTTPADVFRVLALPVPTDIFGDHLRKLMADQSRLKGRNGIDLFVAGRVALAEGRLDEASEKLRSYEVRVVEGSKATPMLNALMLADGWTRKGEPARAIASLESATQLRSAASFGPSTGALWMQTRAKLAEIYRHSGRVSDAVRIEQHLRQLLSVADEDHPLKKHLDSLSAKDSPRSAR
jgi:hypothetical protein